MKRTCHLVAFVLLSASLCCAVTVTNLYHTNRTFRPTPHNYLGMPTPSAYQAWSMAGELTALVGPTNIFEITNQTYATEYEGFAWGYESANAAWTSAVAVYLSYSNVHPGLTFNNAGWVRGTKEAYGTWGAYLWLLQNTIRFESSKTNKWVSENNITSDIVKVLVGSIGD